MNKLLAKMGLGEKMSKNFLAILIVAFSGAISMGCRTSVLTITMYIGKPITLPMCRWAFLEAYLAYSV